MSDTKTTPPYRVISDEADPGMRIVVDRATGVHVGCYCKLGTWIYAFVYNAENRRVEAGMHKRASGAQAEVWKRRLR